MNSGECLAGNLYSTVDSERARRMYADYLTAGQDRKAHLRRDAETVSNLICATCESQSMRAAATRQWAGHDDQLCAIAVLNVGRINNNFQQMPNGIDQKVPFVTFGLFASIVPAFAAPLPLFSYFGLSRIPALG